MMKRLISLVLVLAMGLGTFAHAEIGANTSSGISLEKLYEVLAGISKEITEIERINTENGTRFSFEYILSNLPITVVGILDEDDAVKKINISAPLRHSLGDYYAQLEGDSFYSETIRQTFQPMDNRNRYECWAYAISLVTIIGTFMPSDFYGDPDLIYAGTHILASIKDDPYTINK